MRIGALYLFEKHVHHTTSGGWTVAALHWSNSITWRWLIHWLPADTKMWKVFRHRNNTGIYLDIYTKYFGRINFQTQRNMWRKP